MPQIALISNQHYDNVRISMVPQLFQPTLYILICLMLADIVDEECANGTAVVGRCNGSIPLLSCGIPDLGLDSLCVNLNRPSSELDTNSGLGVKVEFIPSESREQVRLSDAGVSYEHHLEGALADRLEVPSCLRGHTLEEELESGSQRCI